VLQCVAMCMQHAYSVHTVCMQFACSVLQCVAVCLRVLQCVRVESQLSSFVTVVFRYKYSHDTYMYTWQPFATRLVTSILDVHIHLFVWMNIRCASWRMLSCVCVWHTLLMPPSILDVYLHSFVWMNIRCASWRMRSCVCVWHTLLVPFAILDGGKRWSRGMCVTHTHIIAYINMHTQSSSTQTLYMQVILIYI